MDILFGIGQSLLPERITTLGYQRINVNLLKPMQTGSLRTAPNRPPFSAWSSPPAFDENRCRRGLELPHSDVEGLRDGCDWRRSKKSKLD